MKSRNYKRLIQNTSPETKQRVKDWFDKQDKIENIKQTAMIDGTEIDYESVVKAIVLDAKAMFDYNVNKSHATRYFITCGEGKLTEPQSTRDGLWKSAYETLVKMGRV